MLNMQKRLWLLLVLASLWSWTVQAVEFSQKPLFLGSSTQPNIFFMLDNSQSMTWDSLVPEEVANEAKFRFDNDNGTSGNLAGDYEQVFDWRVDVINDGNREGNQTDKQKWLCYAYNRLAYNPEAKYGIWAGVDENGQPFPDYENVDLNDGSNGNANRKVRYNPYLDNDEDLDVLRSENPANDNGTPRYRPINNTRHGNNNEGLLEQHYFYPLKKPGKSYADSSLKGVDCDIRSLSGEVQTTWTTLAEFDEDEAQIISGNWQMPNNLNGDKNNDYLRTQNTVDNQGNIDPFRLRWTFNLAEDCVDQNKDTCRLYVEARWPDSNDADTTDRIQYRTRYTRANNGNTKANNGNTNNLYNTQNQRNNESTDTNVKWRTIRNFNNVRAGDIFFDIYQLDEGDYERNGQCLVYNTKTTCVKYEEQLVGESFQTVCVQTKTEINYNSCKTWEKIYDPDAFTNRYEKYNYADGVRLRMRREARPDPSCSDANVIDDWNGDGQNDQTIDGRVCMRYLPLAQQRNYARWYSYNRKREYVMKLAVSQLIENSTERMGMGVLTRYELNYNAGSGEFEALTNKPAILLGKQTGGYRKNQFDNQETVGRPLADMNKATAKATLLDDLLRLSATGFTPLRSRMLAVGEYFDLNSSSSGKTFANTAMDYRGDPIVKSVLGFDEPTNPADVYLANGGNCQQNFAILLTDGYVNENQYKNIASVVANNDCDSDTAFDYSSQNDANCSQSALDTLGDIAQFYYERDLAPGIANDIRVAGDDENPAQHLLTYTVAFGVDGTIKGMPANRKTSLASWPQPADKTQTSVDDVRHAAWNGRGQFLNAQDPQSLIQALQDVVTLIKQRNTVGSLSAASSTAGQKIENTVAFVQEFKTSDWSGNLLAYSLDTTANLDTLQWDAATKLQDQVTASGFVSRFIATYNGNSVLANWANLTTAMQADLNTAPNGIADGNGEKRLAYLKGDQSNELGSGLSLFRQRGSLIGTLINSGSIYVQKPSSNWPTTFGGYETFVNTYKNRDGIVYFGGNDGLLHAAKADTGEEVFAYMPSLVAANGIRTGLHYLTDPAFNHHYYVDGPLSVQDVKTKSRASGSESWRTLVTAGLGAGARGLFALDVTDPTQFTTANVGQLVMWEFGANDSADIGHITGQPVIAPMQNGKWAVIIGNGYESSSGIAKLMIIYVDGGIDGSWTVTSDYIALSTATGSTGDKNGLSAPAVLDITGPSGLPDGKVDLIYAGDIYGNMWKFDVSNASDASWTVSKLFAGDKKQPITAAPAAGIHPYYKKDKPTMADPNMMVVFGTGQYLGTNDVGNTDQQYLFGVFDNGLNTGVTTGDLVTQTITNETIVDGGTYRLASKNPIDFTTEKGWKLDLPAAGERVIYAPQIRGDLAYFETIIPSGDGCEVQAGSGFLMAVGLAEGGAPEFSTFDRTGDGLIDDNDKIAGEAPVGFMVSGIPGASVFIGDYRITGTSEALPASTPVVSPGADSPGRLSWQELTNF